MGFACLNVINWDFFVIRRPQPKANLKSRNVKDVSMRNFQALTSKYLTLFSQIWRYFSFRWVLDREFCEFRWVLVESFYHVTSCRSGFPRQKFHFPEG